MATDACTYVLCQSYGNFNSMTAAINAYSIVAGLIDELRRKHSKKTYIKYHSLKNYTPEILIKKLRNAVFPNYAIKLKLTENIGNSKELWKTLKKLGLPSKKEGQAKICVEKEGNISFDSKSNAEIFKDFLF